MAELVTPVTEEAPKFETENLQANGGLVGGQNSVSGKPITENLGATSTEPQAESPTTGYLNNTQNKPGIAFTLPITGVKAIKRIDDTSTTGGADKAARTLKQQAA